MKKLLAATLLVAVFAVTGCGDAKTTKPTTTNPPADKTMPADKGKAP